LAIDKTIIPPSEATEVAQAGHDYVNGILPLAQIFPVKSNEGQWVASWTPVVPRSSTRAMQHRALDAEVPHTSSETSTAESHAGLLPLSGMDHISERDITSHANDTAWIHDKAESKFEALGQQAGVAEELERLQILVSGVVSVEVNGATVQKYSFGRPSKQQNVKPSVLWDDVKSNPADDIEAWVKIMRKAYGRKPHAAATTGVVIDALRTNEFFRTQVSGMDLEHSKTKLSRDEVLDVLRTQSGIADVLLVDEAYEDLKLDNTFSMDADISEVFPDKTFILLPSFNDPTLGATVSGPTSEAQNAEYEINKSVNDGLIGAMLTHQAPLNYDIWVNGTYIPILFEAVSTFKADVLA
jgi:hypothetical protein